MAQSRPRPALLASIPQCPFDPASGAVRSAREVCELLASSGWDVTFAGGTGTEAGGTVDPPMLQQLYGIECATRNNCLTFTYRGVAYRLLDSAGLTINQARVTLATEFDALVDGAATPPPDVFLTYGSSESEVRRRAQLRGRGVKVVFFLRNFSYSHERSFAEVDAILTPSRMLTDHYRHVASTPLPFVLALDEIVAPCREPVFYTFINPAPGKGLELFLSIVGLAAEIRPDVPFLAVESRGSGELIAGESVRLGISLGRANLHIARPSPRPHQIYAVTRALLVPSSAPDSGPRVIPEAQLNGIPVIASGRCGLAQPPESFTGFVLPAGAAAAAPRWLEVITRLHDDAAFYQRASLASSQAAEPYRSGATARATLEYFSRLQRNK